MQPPLKQLKDLMRQFFNYKTTPEEDMLVQAICFLAQGTDKFKNKPYDQIHKDLAEEMGHLQRKNQQKWTTKKIDNEDMERAYKRHGKRPEQR